MFSSECQLYVQTNENIKKRNLTSEVENREFHFKVKYCLEQKYISVAKTAQWY